MDINNLANLAKKFICEKCAFKCSNKYDYTRHLSTAKHKKIYNDIKKVESHICLCGKEYQYYSGLWRHKKTCNSENVLIAELVKQNNELKDLIIEQKELIIEQKEQKQELTEVIIEQCKHSKKMLELAQEQKEIAQEQVEEQQQHNKKVLEIAQEQKELTIEQNENQKELMKQIKEKGIGTTNITNNQFNLSVFLNETCKDAMNIDDLYKVIKEFKMPHSLIKAFENTKHATGISNCIDAIMDSIPVNKRPIHCSDLKREIMHYKHNNNWEKEKEIITPFEVMFIRICRNKCNDELLYYQEHFMDIDKDEDEDKYNKMCMHTYFGGDVSETIKIQSRIAKRTCIVREKQCNPLIKDPE